MWLLRVTEQCSIPSSVDVTLAVVPSPAALIMFLLSLKVRSVPCVEYKTVGALVVIVLPPWVVAVLADESVNVPTQLKAFIASV